MGLQRARASLFLIAGIMVANIEAGINKNICMGNIPQPRKLALSF